MALKLSGTLDAVFAVRRKRIGNKHDVKAGRAQLLCALRIGERICFCRSERVI